MVRVELEEEGLEGKNAIEELEALLQDSSFQQAYLETQTAIDSAPQRLKTVGEHEEEFLHLSEELARTKKDPQFLQALGVWGKSPKSDGSRGSAGQGFHAGVVHYFEYRAAGRSKARRCREDGPPTIQGFIDFSIYLKSLVDNPTSNADTRISASVLIEDESEQQRLYLLTHDNLLVVGFKGASDRMRIISAVRRETQERFNKIIEDELSGSPERDARLNRLGPRRRLLS